MICFVHFRLKYTPCLSSILLLVDHFFLISFFFLLTFLLIIYSPRGLGNDSLSTFFIIAGDCVFFCVIVVILVVVHFHLYGDPKKLYLKFRGGVLEL